MKWIYNFSYDELKEELASSSLKKFVVDQVFLWLYGKNIPVVDYWTNIGKNDRTLLAGRFDTRLPTIIQTSGDAEGTKKILVEFPDGLKIEAVLIREKHHYTFCISTQVGCPLNCAFCATGRVGFKRNLSSGEILSQVLLLKKEIPGYTGKLNLVLMGMGEPLLNYENLKKALEVIIAEKGLCISPRNITISTAGILNGLQRFERDFPHVKISLSLNAPNASLREELMPISKKENLGRLLGYFRETQRQRKHRVTFEYVMLKGINDSITDADELVKLVRGIPCKINLIPYNENEKMRFKTPLKVEVDRFSDYLHTHGYTVVVRWSKGRGIKSACGQLAAGGEGESARIEIEGN